MNGTGAHLLPASPPRYTSTPADRGLLAWTADPLLVQSAGAAPTTQGLMQFVRIQVPVPMSVTNIVMYVTSAGSALTSGQCFAGLYAAGHGLVGVTADQATSWAAAPGVRTMPLASGPFTVTPPYVFVGWWYNGTTSPSWARTTSTGAAFANAGVSAGSYFAGTANSGLTTAAPSTLGTQSTSSTYYWAALS